MRSKASLLFGTLVVAALVAAPMSAAWAGTAHKKNTHNVEVTVVAVDAAAKTMTFTTSTGEEKTSPVTGQAINKLKDVKAGEKLTVVCMDDEQGQHQAITDIKMTAKAHSKGKKPAAKK